MRRLLLIMAVLVCYAGAVWGDEIGELQKHMTITLDEVENKRIIKDISSEEYHDEEFNKIDRLSDDMSSLNAEELKSLLEKLKDMKWLDLYVALLDDQKADKVSARFLMGFVKPNGWLFFDKVVINTDGDIDRLSFSLNETYRQVIDANNITEIIELDATQHEALIKKIAGSGKALIRFQGGKGQLDFVISSEQKTALKRVWRLYELMTAGKN